MAYSGEWTWDSQNFQYGKAKGGKGKGGKGKSTTSDYAPQWSNWGSGSFGGRGRGFTRSSETEQSLQNLTSILENQAWESWEEKQTQKKKEAEEATRKAREKEAEERKAERDAMYERIREDRQEMMAALGLRTGGSRDAGRGSGGAGPRQQRSPSPETGRGSGGGGDYKDQLRALSGGGGGAARSQRPLAPVDPKQWGVWKCDSKAATRIVQEFPGTCEKGELSGQGILDCAEALNRNANMMNKNALQEKFEDLAGEDANKRWGKVDLLVAILAEVIPLSK